MAFIKLVWEQSSLDDFPTILIMVFSGNVVGKNHLEVSHRFTQHLMFKIFFLKIASICTGSIWLVSHTQKTEIVKSIIRFCLFLWQGRDMSQNASGLPFSDSLILATNKLIARLFCETKALSRPGSRHTHKIFPLCAVSRALMSCSSGARLLSPRLMKSIFIQHIIIIAACGARTLTLSSQTPRN